MKMHSQNIYNFCKNTLHYQFSNHTWIEQALTHRSSSCSDNNERLEFLGDSILNFTITQYLFKSYSHINEGQLTRIRANLVQKKTLVIIAKRLNLDTVIRLGNGEMRTKEDSPDSILADAFEAIVGAVYMDSDIYKASECILDWFNYILINLDLESSHKDPKTMLQEKLQAQGMNLPSYNVLNIEGPAHKQSYRIACQIDNFKEIFIGIANSRKQAEQFAAKKVIDYLEENKNDS